MPSSYKVEFLGKLIVQYGALSALVEGHMLVVFVFSDVGMKPHTMEGSKECSIYYGLKS